MKNRIFSLIILTQFGIQVYAQSNFLLNFSFEDELHFGISPVEWTTCEKKSTPDVQPGHVGVTLAASHGDTYLGLVMRGSKHPKPKSESVQAELLKMLEKDKTYKFEIDLAAPGAYEERCGRKIIEYKDIPKLKILGVRNDCSQTDLLYETQLVENKDWLTYSFEVTPQSDYNYIKLENSFDDKKASYIICDNFHITELTSNEKKTQEIDLFITNVLTPNNDGKNDFFVIENLPKYSELAIFNKNHHLIYENNNYKNNWGGTDKNGKILTSGTYFYKLNIPNSDKNYSGFVVIKKK